MNGKFQRFIILLIDTILIFSSFMIAYIKRHNQESLSLLFHDFGDFRNLKFFLNLHMPFFKEYMVIFLYGTVIILFCFFYFRLYSFTRNAGKLDEIAHVVQAVTFANVLIIAITFFYRNISVSRLVIINSYILTVIFLSLFRFSRRLFVEWLRLRGFGVRNVLIYGAGDGGKLVKHHLEFHSEMGYNLVGFLDDSKSMNGKEVDNKPVFGNLTNLSGVVVKKNIHDVIIAIPSAPRDKILKAVMKCEKAGVNYFILPNVYDFMTSQISINRMGTVPLMKVELEAKKSVQYIVKRTFDYIFGLFCAILFLPVYLIVAMLIKLESKGPILFSQIRIGKNGKAFKFYKFRTMINDAEKLKARLHKHNEVDGPIFKMKDDPRITKLGKILRKFSIDELPQIFNVLKGDMSFVGPRPPVPEEVKKYEGWQKTRLSVMPGITGLWQVSGRSTLTFEQMVRLDLFYIENWSFWMDFKILISTIPTVIFCKGAY
ncbi:sugar transferase [bacterium]|nr:sugar transferase [bacterium]